MTKHEAQDAAESAQGETNEVRGVKNQDDNSHLATAVFELMASNRLREVAANRRTGRNIMLMLAVSLSFAGSFFYADLRNARVQRENLLQLVETNGRNLRHLDDITSKIVGATTPGGCSFQRSEALRAEAVRRIENDNRILHGRSEIQPDLAVLALIETPCAGEVTP